MQVKGTPWGLPPFAREVYFMLVEDNPFHFAWAESLEGCENLKRYIPPESMQSLDDVTRREESKGYYKSAERAFEVIEGSLNPPDVILADIELPGMDGIEFARKLYERETAAGRKPIIVAIYSSNVFPYEKELEKLKAEGIIVDAWHKSNFNIKQLVDTVNEKLKQRE
jgi:CheY-like chemotaxis protein